MATSITRNYLQFPNSFISNIYEASFLFILSISSIISCQNNIIYVDIKILVLELIFVKDFYVEVWFQVYLSRIKEQD